MVYLVFIIGVLNFVLGYALATYLEPRPAIDVEPVVERVAPSVEPERAESPVDTYFDIGSEEIPEAEPEPVAEEIPSAWLETLEAESIEAKSFVEASVQVLKLEVGRYRADLMEIEEQVRKCELGHDQEEIHSLLERLTTLNEDWLVKQGDAAKHLQSQNGALGEFEEIGSGLGDVLLEQAAQIETTCSNIDMLDFESEVGAGCKRLITEICRLVDLAHQLRDRMQESMISIMQADKRLGELDRKLQFDTMTTLHNRTGLEVMFFEWWREDLIRQRTVSIVMVDIDHFAHLNVRFGTHLGDLLLRAFGKLLEELIRKDTGYDVASRLARISHHWASAKLPPVT